MLAIRKNITEGKIVHYHLLGISWKFFKLIKQEKYQETLDAISKCRNAGDKVCPASEFFR
jgi:hypothetical protein